MKMRSFSVLIRRDAVETISRDAFSTEIPVLQAVYGDALAMDPNKPAQLVDRDDDLCTPDLELERLTKRYGPEAVQAAFGTNAAAVREIRELMREDYDLAKTEAPAADVVLDEAFLAGTVDAIAAKVPELSDEELPAYLAAEQAGKNRKGVVEAMTAELEARKAEDAAQ